jgi:hypothetical protein
METRPSTQSVVRLQTYGYCFQLRLVPYCLSNYQQRGLTTYMYIHTTLIYVTAAYPVGGTVLAIAITTIYVYAVRPAQRSADQAGRRVTTDHITMLAEWRLAARNAATLTSIHMRQQG